jgi:hypothetical protein
MQGVAEADEPGARGAVLGSKKAGYTPTVRLPADDELASGFWLSLRPLAIDGNRQLGLAEWQVDRGGRDSARLEAIHMPLHGGGFAGASVGDDDAHRVRVADDVTHKLARLCISLTAMEAANIVQLPEPEVHRDQVRVSEGRVIVDALTLAEPGLATFVAERPPDERPALVGRALRIGLIALQDAGASLDVDVVRREFEAMVRQTETLNERVTTQVDELLRQNFADGDGRLPRTLETFLGDRGQLRTFTRELFDEDRRDSAIGRMRVLLGSYFEGDASRLAQLLDPTRLGSPLHQFRSEVSKGFEQLNERLTAIEAAATARASERAKSVAKGADFEDLIEGLLADSVRGSDHLVERTADVAGNVIRSKKGDFVLTLDPATARGATLRVVVECKDRSVSGKAMRDELIEARRNRDAAVGLVVFSTAHAPAGIAPFDVRMGDVYCAIDPADPEPATLHAAVRLARLLALSTVRDVSADVDAAAVQDALERISAELDAVRGLKTRLSTIGTAAKAVNAGLDQLREGILARIAEAEAELKLDTPA